MTIVPLDSAHLVPLSTIRSYIAVFLRQRHRQLLEQLSPLIACPNCINQGGDHLCTPGSFSEAELQSQPGLTMEV